MLSCDNRLAPRPRRDFSSAASYSSAIQFALTPRRTLQELGLSEFLVVTLLLYFNSVLYFPGIFGSHQLCNIALSRVPTARRQNI